MYFAHRVCPIKTKPVIKFFRRIREKLVYENRFGKYLIYAVGEIILVVIGILIALQVNNLNSEKIERIREEKYLRNIVLDLKKDLASLDYLIAFRETRIQGDQDIINHINGAPIENLTEVTRNVVNSMMEERFSPNNSTVSELSNSGNLSLISNDSIKVLLLELNEMYKSNEFAIAHEEFDYREYISKPTNQNIKLNKLFPVFKHNKSANEQNIDKDDFADLFKSREYENGLVIMLEMHHMFIPIYEGIKLKSEHIIQLIGQELRE
jgi:hypothetical protein